MDNGLIFPYRQCSALTSPVMLTTRNLAFTGSLRGVWVWGGAWDPSR